MTPFDSNCGNCRICEDEAADRRGSVLTATEPYCYHPGCPIDEEVCPRFCPLIDDWNARQWDAILNGPSPDDDDRLAICHPGHILVFEHELRQAALARAYGYGRMIGLADMPLAVPAHYQNQERSEAYVRGWERGRDEIEANEGAKAAERLQWDEEPERSHQ